MVILKAYQPDDGGDVVSNWFRENAGNVKVLAALDARMDFLKYQPRDSWTRPRYDILKKCRGLGEIRFKVGTVQHRALGYFGPERMEFSFLNFCTHTEDYDPRNALQIGMKRMEEVIGNPSRSIVIQGRWSQ